MNDLPANELADLIYRGGGATHGRRIARAIGHMGIADTDITEALGLLGDWIRS